MAAKSNVKLDLVAWRPFGSGGNRQLVYQTSRGFAWYLTEANGRNLQSGETTNLDHAKSACDAAAAAYLAQTAAREEVASRPVA